MPFVSLLLQRSWLYDLPIVVVVVGGMHGVLQYYHGAYARACMGIDSCLLSAGAWREVLRTLHWFSGTKIEEAGQYVFHCGRTWAELYRASSLLAQLAGTRCQPCESMWPIRVSRNRTMRWGLLQSWFWPSLSSLSTSSIPGPYVHVLLVEDMDIRYLHSYNMFCFEGCKAFPRLRCVVLTFCSLTLVRVLDIMLLERFRVEGPKQIKIVLLKPFCTQ